MSTEPQNKEPIPVLVADVAPFTLAELADVRVFGPDLGKLIAGLGGELKAGAVPKLSEEVRRELITRVRAGEHVELEVTATVFRQKDGMPNRNGLRFKSSKLGKIAKSFRGKPALVDHRTWSSSARIGTILDSELVDLPDGWAGFRQTLRIVKPDAVISVLDGTLDRFSVGWDATGPVNCTAHGTPVFEGCRCWPLDRVAIDGEERIAEYEFTSAEGDETSSVNTPAVTGTKIDEVRAALAASLKKTPERPSQMAFPRLAAALTLAALTETDDERAAASVEEIKRGKLAAETERDAYKQRATAAEAALEVERKRAGELEASAAAIKLDAVIEGAYRAGKLLATRDAAGARVADAGESAIREMGAVLGVAKLEAYVKTLPTKVPLGQRRDELPGGELDATATSSIPAPVLASTARQLGLDAKALTANAELAAGGRRTVVPFTRSADVLTPADKDA